MILAVRFRLFALAVSFNVTGVFVYLPLLFIRLKIHLLRSKDLNEWNIGKNYE